MSNEVKKDLLSADQSRMNNAPVIEPDEEISDFEANAGTDTLHGESEGLDEKSSEETERDTDPLNSGAEGKARRTVRLRKASQSRNGEDAPEKKSIRKSTARRKAPVSPQESEISLNPLLEDIPPHMPILPLRDNVVFNSMIVPLYESREKAILGVDAALAEKRYMLLCTQKDPMVEDPGEEDLHPVGTVVSILRMLRMPDGQVKILVQGLSRARLEGISASSPILVGRVSVLVEEASHVPEIQREAMIRSAREQSEKILHLRGIPTGDIMSVLMAVDDPGRLADLIAANMRLKVRDALALLDCLDPVKRLQLVNEHLAREVEVASMQAHIQSMAKEGMDKAQKDYFLREQMKAIRRELGDNADFEEELDELKTSLDKAGLPAEARKEADKQLKRLASMHGDSAEATVVRTYLDWLAELPWKKTSRDRLDIIKARELLDEDHFGLEKIKDRILEYLSVRKLSADSKGPILCFVGPPGVGKTSLGRSIARAMGRKFQRISLGGMRDEAEIRGHRRTYIGAMPGRIIQAVKQAGTRNPVIVLDEIDKLGNDFRGDPASALLEVLDPEQNAHFSDHYLNLEFDLSKVLFICTANQLESIPGPLQDRMEIISLPGYTEQEKLAIAKKYLLPRQIRENGLKEKDIRLADAALAKIIREYTREAGLRSLEREMGKLCRKLARRKAEGEKGPFSVNIVQLPRLLGSPRFLDEDKEDSLPPGVALGLAWTAAGGEVLHIEASVMKGKGGLLLTGQLGEVMKESAQAALSYARAHAGELGIAPDFTETKDIHIHVPAGAIPKDGPSAGVTMVTALVSALTGRSARSDTCMTGEITLRGRVLPVGGIKEKILGAVARGLKRAFIPRQNKKDLDDIPAELRRKIDITPVDSIDALLPLVLTDAPKGQHPVQNMEKKEKRSTRAKTRKSE